MPRGARVPEASLDTVAEVTVRTVRMLARWQAMRVDEDEDLKINDAVLPERKVEKSPREVAMSFRLLCVCQRDRD